MSDAVVRARAESLERRHGMTRGARPNLLRIVGELDAHERVLEAAGEDAGLPWGKSVIVLTDRRVLLAVAGWLDQAPYEDVDAVWIRSRRRTAEIWLSLREGGSGRPIVLRPDRAAGIQRLIQSRGGGLAKPQAPIAAPAVEISLAAERFARERTKAIYVWGAGDDLLRLHASHLRPTGVEFWEPEDRHGYSLFTDVALPQAVDVCVRLHRLPRRYLKASPDDLNASFTPAAVLLDRDSD